MLELNQLSFSYPDHAYQFNLRLLPGQAVAIEGPSGSGKSTLLNLIAGFLTPHAGHISWEGHSWLQLAPWQRPLSTLFQEHNLFEHLPVWANIGVGIHPGLKLSAAQQQQIIWMLEQLGLGGMRERMPAELSGGQRQRVALARVMLRAQPLLLLDEPFTGVDDDTRQRLWLQVLNMKKQGTAIILVSHDSEDIEALADQRLVLHQGHLHPL
ncbi:thiamine ABC transporter ATP-binding protein [Balneatrix alpica]|uniref:ATP-binding cassette domain-containing protein n=1 Tax=Balneatrix alpica TaxID=75684 RepID=A0ABV5ZAW5_9GAMM|nr:ATP-binding cassette domain-containing protein [Balneatrix alpica]